ncbi:lipid IV(A) 3-deoxy-D-manno-octulosonic acid transferase [Planctobacterium marinum]|uniref:lipid IV(A) 3-deoxy-D-manno-octulosonic acid transferase n=1 Tax=Planctobacterium marinum TaxID=1631968 RepID=UPI001E557826|nr:lipid IV(A) 3-deoxy-D-manno-octulosonic acid transferase [Planctobacterium marinum]MCC2606436.1 lipid IV(A) 3-deoxy-D-manno-octulosonic acid transferase [Planctobacterium marinum]
MHEASYKPTLKEFIARWLYSGLIALFIPLAFLNLLIKAGYRGQEYRKRKFERFGFLPKIKQRGGLLLHCVSVGEVVAASALVKKIRQQHPQYPVTITTTTPTGSAQVKKTFGDSVCHVYLPYDLHMAMYGLLRRVAPQKVLITEVELWPNLIHACWKANIPVYIINARLTDKSARSYAKLKTLFRPMLCKITAVCAQGQRDFDNYMALGCPQEKLHLTNNIKFDQTLSEDDQAKAVVLAEKLQLQGRTVLLGASTHDPEEKALLQSYQTLKSAFPKLLLILTPRHPQRFSRVEKLIAGQPLKQQRLSDDRPVTADTDVLLIDAMGILKSVYHLADIAFVGGSLADKGGHNALEAALFSKPVIMGPHLYNNPVIFETLVNAQAMVSVPNEQQLCEQIQLWLAHPEQASAAGKAGAAVIAHNAGAIDQTLAIIGFA